MKTYRVNEVFRSKQGEGFLMGTPMVFVRFTGCNMECRMEAGPKSPGGFDCDTEFASGRTLNAKQVVEWISMADVYANPMPCSWVLFTGGEPALQLDDELIQACKDAGYRTAIETNGSKPVPTTLDYVTVSPKVAEHAIKQRTADEVRYVRGYGQALPKTVVDAKRKYISPAFDGTRLDEQVLQWCKDLVAVSEWELSVQTHKIEGLR